MENTFAKESISKEGKINIGLSRSHVRLLLKQEAIEIHQDQWDDQSTRGCFTHQLVPKVSMRRLW